MSELKEAKKGIYQVNNRTTGDRRLAVATSADGACVSLGWLIGDCYVNFYRTLTGIYQHHRRFDLVAVPCETCPYQYAECRKPEGTECPVTLDVPDLNQWIKKISLAHLCDFVGEDIDKSHHQLHQKLIPFEEAIKELTPKP